MMKRVALVLVAFMCGTASLVAADFSLTLGHGSAPDNPRNLVAREFADAIRERTGGRVEIDVHHSESLGSDRQMAEALMLGTLDMSINSQGPMAAYNDRLSVIGLPFLFSTPEQAYAVLDGEIGAELARPFERKNMKILAYWDNGFRHVTNNVRPIQTADDLNGLVIRTPDDKLTTAIFEAMGAEPVPFAFGKLYEALQMGHFDGQENSLANIYYSKLHDVQKYLSLTRHKYECCPLAISMRTWRTFPDDIRAVFEATAVEFAARHRDVSNRLEQEIMDSLAKSGIEINTADAVSMKEKSRSVYSGFEKPLGKDLIKRIQETIK